MKHILVCVVSAAAALAPASFADPYPFTSAVSATQNGGPTVTPLGDGNNLWDTNLTWTNNGSTALGDVYFVNPAAWFFSNSTPLSWDNTKQEWVDVGNGDIAEASNPALSLTLDPSVTNITIPSGFGLTTGDSVPAFLISNNLAAGASVTTDVNFELSPSVTTFYFNGDIVGTPVPEPASILLLATVFLGVVWIGRRKLARGIESAPATDRSASA